MHWYLGTQLVAAQARKKVKEVCRLRATSLLEESRMMSALETAWRPV